MVLEATHSYKYTYKDVCMVTMEATEDGHPVEGGSSVNVTKEADTTCMNIYHMSPP